MKDLRTLIKPEMNIAKRTLDFVKKQLSGIEFAVTGSYANTLLNKSDSFNEHSDLDIIVEEKYVEMVANILLTLSDYNKIEKVKAYGGSGGGAGGGGPSAPSGPTGPWPLPEKSMGTLPKYNAIEKTKKYDPPKTSKKINEKNKGFSEYMLKGNSIPVHIIGSYTNNQKNEAVNIKGIKYLKPILPKYLRLAA